MRLVLTQPDRPSGRGRKLSQPPVKILAIELGIPVYQPERIRGAAIIEKIKSYGVDCAAVVAFGQILPKAFLDVFARWGLPVVLCARTALGTINHTLLSLKALRDACVPVMGVAFIGKPEAETEHIISQLGNARVLGRLPPISRLDHSNVQAAFHEGFGDAPFL